MALPTRDEVSTLDYSGYGQPAAYLEAASGLSSSTLDYSGYAQPVVGIAVTISGAVVSASISEGGDLSTSDAPTSSLQGAVIGLELSASSDTISGLSGLISAASETAFLIEALTGAGFLFVSADETAVSSDSHDSSLVNEVSRQDESTLADAVSGLSDLLADAGEVSAFVDLFSGAGNFSSELAESSTPLDSLLAAYEATAPVSEASTADDVGSTGGVAVAYAADAGSVSDNAGGISVVSVASTDDAGLDDFAVAAFFVNADDVEQFSFDDLFASTIALSANCSDLSDVLDGISAYQTTDVDAIEAMLHGDIAFTDGATLAFIADSSFAEDLFFNSGSFIASAAESSIFDDVSSGSGFFVGDFSDSSLANDLQSSQLDAYVPIIELSSLADTGAAQQAILAYSIDTSSVAETNSSVAAFGAYSAALAAASDNSLGDSSLQANSDEAIFVSDSSFFGSGLIVRAGEETLALDDASAGTSVNAIVFDMTDVLENALGTQFTFAGVVAESVPTENVSAIGNMFSATIEQIAAVDLCLFDKIELVLINEQLFPVDLVRWIIVPSKGARLAKVNIKPRREAIIASKRIFKA